MRQTDIHFIKYFQKVFRARHFRLKNMILFLIVISSFYQLLYTSCANAGGGPSGGPKDSIPPVVVKTIPELRGTNYTGNDIRISFDEYIIPDEISEKLVVSPPMKKRPTVKMKGKTLILEFPDGLKKDKTYSLDFKDGVADNNEKNPIEDFRFSFSTGPVFDSLRVSGYIKDALTQEPVEKAVVMLYHENDYTAFTDSIPDYIGKTDKDGIFMIDNVSPGTYRLYALMDADNSLTYNSKSEKIAFADSLIIPSAKYVVRNDTVISGSDTLLVSGHVDYSPGPQYLEMFEEESFEQFLNDSKRTQGNKCDFYFSESLSDSFDVKLIKPVPAGDWKYIESNLKRDSITVWITDTIVSNTDTLKFALQYEVLDSLNQLVLKHDTIDLIHTQSKAAKAKRKKNEKEEAPTIMLSTNINPTAHNIYQRIQIEAPEPLLSFDLSKVRLFSLEDTIKTQLSIQVQQDSNSVRKYFVEQHWEPEGRYVFEIDSAAAKNIYGYPNKKIEEKFKIQREAYYGKIFLTISGLTEPAIVQLLSGGKEEKVLQKIQVLGDGKIEFPYLKPEKYKIRLIFDLNKNGKWDTGFLADGLQPEKVIYYPKVIKVRSNFEYKENWDATYKPDYKKELIDEDAEKDKTKKKDAAKKPSRK